MNRASSVISLNPANPLPIYRQIYLRIKEAIIAGKLKPGERLPSVRSLASELSLARGTIDNAYAMLVSEGFIESKGQSGTRVCDHIHPSQVAFPRRKPSSQPEKKNATPHLHDFSHQPFQLGLPALDAFPLALWNRLSGKQIRNTPRSSLSHPPAAGYQPLREAIARYLQLSRGISCHPQQIFICGGYAMLLRLIIDTLFHRGDAIFLEDPGYLLSHKIFNQAGANIIPVDVDREGIQIEPAIKRFPTCRFALVTPAHQSPSGVTLSLPRRMALLEWAAQNQAWIIEDDYDGEFRYQSHPLPALKSLDSHNRVLYAGTFSKVLFPALRTAYLVVPESQIEKFEESVRILPCTSPVQVQGTIADFINENHFYRHLKNMRTLYAQRREILIQAIKNGLSQKLEIETHYGGIHLILHLENHMDDKQIALRARANGLSIEALSDWCIKPSQRQGLLLSFTNIATDQQAAHYIQQLSEAIYLESH
ncbi:PLP-dependent aminotransferase family protein [Pragia fontium]|uniref:MocR-like pyridoxine biosynthesis transcription factor PdxR n=1 Tax=Pragia fontium TaxID=82985 RepID=UPI00064B1F1A|nr:PLP-dependent aminotransferase family protein [Pragia fontium]AKJ41156.1 DNA-binding protein [Pragia fontium]